MSELKQSQSAEKIALGVSSCLLGDKVRYDGGHKYNALIAEGLGEQIEFRKFCPEVEIGLSIPRDPIHLLRFESGDIHCVAVADENRDFTNDLGRCAGSQDSWQSKLCGYIFKSKSPSCGLTAPAMDRAGQSGGNGVGVYAGQLVRNFPWLPVIDERLLEDSRLRKNFLQRVRVIFHWQQLRVMAVTVKSLGEFHARHCPQRDRQNDKIIDQLDALISEVNEDNLASNSAIYLCQLMAAMTRQDFSAEESTVS